MPEEQDARRIESLVRALSAAAKSLRLYPPTNPMPRQSVEAVRTLLEEYFSSGMAVLSLKVAREGFVMGGQAVAGSGLGAELLSDLQGHGVAELDFLPGSSIDEILAFLGAVSEDPQEVRTQGGISVVLASAGVDTVRVIDVHLTVADQVGPAADQDIDEFLRELARDPDKLSAWYAAAASGDPHTFEEGLLELVRVSGPGGLEGLLESLSGAFTAQNHDCKDALMGLAMDAGPVRDLAGGMFSFLESGEIAGAVLGGAFGKNMLSLSTALTRLPLEQVTAQVRAEVQAMLPGTGHSDKESRFLEHMIGAREGRAAEKPLADADGTYRKMMEVAALPQDALDRARATVSGSAGALTAASVHTISTLLDQQEDFELFCQGADSLAAMVPRLIEQGDLEMAARVLADLSNRMANTATLWPALPERLRASIEVATGPTSMTALMARVAEDTERVEVAKRILRHGGESAAKALVAEAMSHKAEGIAVAEQLVGRRIVDILGEIAATAQWFQVRPVVARLAREGDSRSMQVVEALLRRSDEQSRREVAGGLADAGSPAAMRLLGIALKDPQAEVAIVAARAVARSGQPGAAALLVGRLSELDHDGNDFIMAREFIAALARVPEPAAEEALKKLASRKALIKRGHFAEIQDLVARALEHRAKGGIGR